MHRCLGGAVPGVCWQSPRESTSRTRVKVRAAFVLFPLYGTSPKLGCTFPSTDHSAFFLVLRDSTFRSQELLWSSSSYRTLDLSVPLKTGDVPHVAVVAVSMKRLPAVTEACRGGVWCRSGTSGHLPTCLLGFRSSAKTNKGSQDVNRVSGRMKMRYVTPDTQGMVKEGGCLF